MTEQDQAQPPPARGPVEAPDRFIQAWAKICEWFPDALLIVRDQNKKLLRWKSTDATWAIGACDRYRESVRRMDDVDYAEQTEGRDEQ